MKNEELSYNLGDTVDRLISVQYFMSGGGSALTRKPVTGVLYEAAREKAGAPLCHLAAKALADNVERGRHRADHHRPDCTALHDRRRRRPDCRRDLGAGD